MLLGPTNLFGFKLEIMLEISLTLVFSATETKWLLKIFVISTGFVAVSLLCFKVLGRNIF